MQKQLLYKCLLLIALGIMLMVPLSMIQSTISERSYFRDEAVRKVAANSAGSQILMGPIIVIPVEEEVDEVRQEGEGKDAKSKTVHNVYKRDVVLYPKKLNLDGALKVERRAYGLHQVAVYEMQGAISGDFDPPAESDLPAMYKNGHVRWGKPRLIVGLSDTRGLVSEPNILLGEQALKVERGTGLQSYDNSLGNGFQAPIPMTVPGMTKRLPFRIELKLAGTESFGVIPLGDQTSAHLSSNWANPSFGGGFLPRDREVDDNGFRAQWSVSALAANIQQDLFNKGAKALVSHPENGSVEDMNSFRVTLVDPVDIYHQAVRAAKYGLLFIVLTFAAFFMFETVRNLPIHPIQYGLVGLALAMFFLLLLSLSEHMEFALAYAISALACIALIVVYLVSVLRGWGRALGFGSGMGLLFGALFGVLLSEQNALLLGSLLLFIVLAALMLTTRKVDWYRLKPATSGVTA